jgi:hypothetical protein
VIRLKLSTHYLFSLGLSSIYGVYIITEPLLSWIIILLSLGTSCFSWTPNLLDGYISIRFENEGVNIVRARHPLSHSPWTVGYFIPLFYLAEKVQIPFFQVLISLMTISWVSHLILDVLNPGGLPLGKTPVFSNHSSKHYRFHWTVPMSQKQLQFGKIPFNSVKANRRLGQFGLFIFSVNLAQKVILTLRR